MTAEEIRSADIEAVNQRLDEITAEIGTAADADMIQRAEEEMDLLEERKAALKREAEERAAMSEKVSGGAGKVSKVFEKDEEERKMFGIESMEYRSAWLKNMQGVKVSEEERTALANGNYAIPTETLNRIVGKMELYPLLNAVDVLRIPGFVEIPVEGTVNKANVVAMGTAATDSEDSLGHVSLAAYKIIKTVEITADVAAMAVPAFETWLVDRLANKVYREVTALVAKGTGTNQPTGLTSVDATGHTYTKAGITYKDVMGIIAALPTEYLTNAKFVMSRTTFWGNVMSITDTAGNPVVVADRQAPAKYNVMGFEVILEDELGTDIVFGDLKEGYIWNFGKEIAVERDESVGFRAGTTVYRGMCLGDGKPTGVGLVRYTKAA